MKSSENTTVEDIGIVEWFFGCLLASIAGAINAGGFLVVHRYTSHMTGVVAGVADDIALGYRSAAWSGLAFLCCFLAGAMTTAILVNIARAKVSRSEFSTSLQWEALLLVLFGLSKLFIDTGTQWLIPAATALLCYVMGLQNALTTKLTGAVIRTTHMTGVITDLGIELGKMLYWNSKARTPFKHVRADRRKVTLLTLLLLSFAAGGLIGALAFSEWGFFATLPIAALLVLLSLKSLRQRANSRKQPPI